MSAGSGGAIELSAASRANIDAQTLIQTLHRLRHAPRDASYWPLLCQCLSVLTRADSALLLSLGEAGWEPLCDELPVPGALAGWPALIDDLAARALRNGFARGSSLGGRGHLVAAVRLAGPRETLALLAIPERERAQLNELLLRAQLVADLPAENSSVHAPAAGGGSELLELLDLVVQVQREQRFGAASLALVNGVVAQLGCAQAALGWRRDGYVKAQAVSHIDRFERSSEEIGLLEAAFEEALDQEQEIAYPDDADGGGIVIAHARLLQALGYTQVLSLPLRSGTEPPQAVLLLAQQEDRLEPRRMAQLQLALGLLLPWLTALRERDRWWGLRLAAWTKLRLQPVLGPEHVGRKLLVIALSLLLMYFLFGSWSYRVEATSQLTTDSTVLVSAPFDGYLDEVAVTAGDEVAEGALLGSLDTQELFLQESEIRADIRRYEAEADKARAVGNLVEVGIADARRSQAQARLDRVLYYLRQARIEAPFAAVVVEGERRDLLGAPVEKGEQLFRLARIEGLYAMLMVPERDVRDVAVGASGELALLSQPDRTIPLRVTAIIPTAQVKGQEGNQFLVKAELTQPPEDWWRPGMSGVVRIDAGERNIAWILTHRMLDALRLKFWW